MMNKQDLSARLAEKTNRTKKECNEIVNAMIETMMDGIVDTGELFLYGFGKFTIKNKASRNCVNPKTGEKLVIPASKTVGFKVAKTFKERVNK